MSRPNPEPAAAPPPTDPSRAAARALLAMLGEGQGGAQPAPDAEMRRMARDLLAQADAEAGQAGPAAAARGPQVPPLRRVFSRAAPLAGPAAPVARDEPEPARGMPAAAHPGPAADADPVLPTALAATAAVRPHRSPVLVPARVRAILEAAGRPRQGEHPIIVALGLEGRTPLAQAEALRAMPRGQARVVHRALRQLQAAAGASPEGGVSA